MSVGWILIGGFFGTFIGIAIAYIQYLWEEHKNQVVIVNDMPKYVILKKYRMEE